MPSTHADAAPMVNGHHDDASHLPSPTKKGAKSKKAGAKSTSDEASRLLQARISQLEQDAAGEKDQEMEIGEHFLPRGVWEGLFSNPRGSNIEMTRKSD
jgi:hypothetical protein